MAYLDSAWLDSTREFLNHSSAQIEIPEIPLPQLQRENDACIMDGFIEHNLPNHTLKRLNLCRLWLRVTLLSDICTLPGSQISRTTWLGSAPMPSSDASWPVQPRPQEKSWTLWRKALSKSGCMYQSQTIRPCQPTRGANHQTRRVAPECSTPKITTMEVVFRTQYPTPLYSRRPTQHILSSLDRHTIGIQPGQIRSSRAKTAGKSGGATERGRPIPTYDRRGIQLRQQIKYTSDAL
jgi:hypothetical protein